MLLQWVHSEVMHMWVHGVTIHQSLIAAIGACLVYLTCGMKFFSHICFQRRRFPFNEYGNLLFEAFCYQNSRRNAFTRCNLLSRLFTPRIWPVGWIIPDLSSFAVLDNDTHWSYISRRFVCNNDTVFFKLIYNSLFVKSSYFSTLVNEKPSYVVHRRSL